MIMYRNYPLRPYHQYQSKALNQLKLRICVIFQLETVRMQISAILPTGQDSATFRDNWTSSKSRQGTGRDSFNGTPAIRQLQVNLPFYFLSYAQPTGSLDNTHETRLSLSTI